MTRAVLPKVVAREAWFLTGFLGGVPQAERKADVPDNVPEVDKSVSSCEADGGRADGLAPVQGIAAFPIWSWWGYCRRGGNCG